MARTKVAAPEAPAPAPQEKLGEIGDRIYAMNAEIAAANKVVDELQSKKRELEDLLMSRMDEAGTDIVRGAAATVSISESVKPQIQDFDALATFVIRRKALHLFERRIASTAYKELRDEIGKPIPGVSEFVARRLNVRKVS